ncbi:NAD(P)H-hydrate dehydratase [soil metagenome]
MLVSCEEMRRLEEAAFARGIRAGDLMEEAARGIAQIVRQFHPVPGQCIAYCGKGNNAGDALVALKFLKEWGWDVSVSLAFKAEDFSELPAAHYQSLQPASFGGMAGRGRPLVVLDGLLGSGAKGEPRDPIAGEIAAINRLRREHAAWVLAIDLPSGLQGDTGEPASHCVEADLTATIGYAKLGLVRDTATNFVGRLALIPLEDLEQPTAIHPGKISTSVELAPWLPPRSYDQHKGNFGRVGIIAGSPGYLGAARMCSAAAVKAGGGLVTLYVKAETQMAFATACIPEVMVKVLKNYRDILDENLDVIAIGPGLGTDSVSEVTAIVQRAKQPMVVDADALNIVARDITLLKYCAGPRLLTPHPGEMERLLPQRSNTRREWLEDFIAKYPVTLLLKGARTVIGWPEGERYYNPTGNPGMGSGGMGDVLTGVCAALIGQLGADGMSKAAVLGAWLCGRAAERAIFAGSESPESLCAEDIISHLGGAFSDLRRQVY